MLCDTMIFVFFFFNDTATTEIYTLSLHDALPIWCEFCCERVLPTRCVKTQGDLFIEPANRDGKEVSPGMPSRNSRKGRKKKAAEIPRGSHDARSCNPRTCTSTTAPSEAQTEIGCKLTKAGY